MRAVIPVFFIKVRRSDRIALMELRSDLPQRMSFEPIRYSQVWEDHALIEAALRPAPLGGGEGDIVSICSAGCNVLSLLRLEPRRILAIDLSRAQLALAELRLRAALVLDLPAILELLTGGTKAVGHFEKIRFRLSKESQSYWDARTEDLRKGVASSGMLERYFAHFRDTALTPAFAGAGGLQALADTKDLETQRAIYAKADRGLLREKTREFFSQQALEKQGRDPEQFRYVQGQDLGLHFFRKFEDTFNRSWIGENPYLTFMLTGKPRALPYLSKVGLERIRAARTEVVFELGDLESRLSSAHDASIAACNLSDVFEYMSSEHAAKVFSLLQRKLIARGRVAFWNLLVDRKPPPNTLQILTEESRKLSAEDRLWLYQSFQVCEKS